MYVRELTVRYKRRRLPGAAPLTQGPLTVPAEAAAMFIKLPSLTINGVLITSGSASVANGSVIVDPAPNASASRYRAGTRITMTALPSAGNVLLQWTGPCAGSGVTCTLTAEGDKVVAVIFAPVRLSINGQLVNSNVNVIGVPNGSVEISPPPSIPPGLFTTGTQVTLTARPNVGMKFKSWAGACAGQPAVCQVTMDGAKQATVEIGP